MESVLMNLTIEEVIAILRREDCIFTVEDKEFGKFVFINLNGFSFIRIQFDEESNKSIDWSNCYKEDKYVGIL